MTDAERIAALEAQVAQLTKERDEARCGLEIMEGVANLAIASAKFAAAQLEQASK